MSIIISIVGRPNTGKSTLFNALTEVKKSLTDDLPGVTRDTITGKVYVDEFLFTLFDTAGLYFGSEIKSDDSLESKINGQIYLAINESDAVIFLTDRKAGYSADDKDIYDKLRRSNKKVYFCVNKVDNQVHETSTAEFFESGSEKIYLLSAAHKSGLGELKQDIKTDFSGGLENEFSDTVDLSLAVIGRPNTGKSTLINALLGYQKQIVHDMSGTTRDSVDSFFKFHGKTVRIVDTAGIRRKNKVNGKIEKMSVFSAIRAIDSADIVLLIISSEEIAADQEMKLAAYVKKSGKPMIIIINKWDLYTKDSGTVNKLRAEIKEKMTFIAYCPILFISAKTGQRLGELVQKCFDIHMSTANKLTPNRLITTVKRASEAHMISLSGGKKDKIMFASQLSERPPTFLMRVKYPDNVPENYKSYIENVLRKQFNFEAQPIKIYWKAK